MKAALRVFADNGRTTAREDLCWAASRFARANAGGYLCRHSIHLRLR